MKCVTPILGVLVLFSGTTLAQNAPNSQQEQLSFEIGHRGHVVKHLVPLSDADLAALSNAKLTEISDLMPGRPTPAPSFVRAAREGLEAALVHLNAPNETDLLVIGSGRQYVRADLAPFWVIRERPGGPVVILGLWTHELQMLQTKHHGLTDLLALRDTGMGTAATSFTFNGYTYVEGMTVTN